MKFIKHKKMKDVCIQVFKTFYIPEKKCLEIKGSWWNMAYIQSFPIGISFKKKIPINELKENWLYTDEIIDCLRNATWREYEK